MLPRTLANAVIVAVLLVVAIVFGAPFVLTIVHHDSVPGEPGETALQLAGVLVCLLAAGVFTWRYLLGGRSPQ